MVHVINGRSLNTDYAQFTKIKPTSQDGIPKKKKKKNARDRGIQLYQIVLNTLIHPQCTSHSLNISIYIYI
jgi:hypothetical protein